MDLVATLVLISHTRASGHRPSLSLHSPRRVAYRSSSASTSIACDGEPTTSIGVAAGAPATVT